MAESQRDVKNRIASVKNIQTITRAMEMVAAARLRRAEQRIGLLAPYANGIRRMTRQAAAAAGTLPDMPILAERDRVENVAYLLIAGDRGLAGAFNSQIVRAGVAAARESEQQGQRAVFFASGKRPAASLRFRGLNLAEAFEGFSDRPAYGDAEAIAQAVIGAYVEGSVDRVEVFYNHYISAVSQQVTREVLLPLQQASILGDEADAAEEESDRGPGGFTVSPSYEPGPAEILGRLVPDYVEVSIYRALLDSTASEHGARMSAMRNATDNANTIIDDLTLAMNRARQAAITQEIAEVVAGAEGVA
jgi:F-type H+-transporting ATPase subunit gamma